MSAFALLKGVSPQTIQNKRDNEILVQLSVFPGNEQEAHSHIRACATA